MKRISLILILILFLGGCSPYSLEIKIKPGEEVESVKESAAIPPSYSKEENWSGEDDSSSFYGIWCSGSKSKSDAEKFALELVKAGFDARVFVTTDWENLNPEKFYVVTAGMCKTKQEAETILDVVKNSGYKDAYIKHTGKRK